MERTNDWYCFINTLDKNTCDKIINLTKDKWEKSSVNVKKGITDEERKTGEKLIHDIDKNERISDIVWTNEKWIYDTVYPYMEQANEKAGWKYDIRAAEQMQITRYKKGEFYYFHTDGMSDHLSVNDINFVRKLSMTVLLNDNYEGGEFQFATYGKEKCKIETPEFNKIGSIIIFPSDVEHRVAPVTKGIRYSLVTWFLGPPFK